MKIHEAKAYLPFVQAAAEGKRIQWRSGDKWKEFEPGGFEITGSAPEDLRIAPEPKLRPWTPEEVPVGALLRRKGTRGSNLILAATEDCRVVIPGFDKGTKVFLISDWTNSGIVDGCEHSTDGGKTWRPCGVEE